MVSFNIIGSAEHTNFRAAYSYNYIDGSTLQGLPLLHEVLFKIKDHEHLVSVMQDNLRTSPISLDAMTGVFSSSDQDSRRSECPSERDRMQEERAPFPFRGDGEPGESPLAWTTIWGGTYSNLYGYYLTDTMRRCGYVFWDAARLERTGVMEVLVQEWKREWEQEDPRDMVFL